MSSYRVCFLRTYGLAVPEEIHAFRRLGQRQVETTAKSAFAAPAFRAALLVGLTFCEV